MNEEKQQYDSGSADSVSGDDPKSRSHAASRAKNQTVMLSPEITGQVRAMLNREHDPNAALNQTFGHSAWERPGHGGIAPARPAASLQEDAGEGSSGAGRVGGVSAHLPIPPRVTTPPIIQPSMPQPQISMVKPQPQTYSAPLASPAAAGVQVITHGKLSPIIGFLVSYDEGDIGQVCELRTGRWLVSSQCVDQGNYILLNDESISPLHAIIRVSKEGKIQVLDQLSEFGTGVLKSGESEETEISGAMVEVEHGDRVRFGERQFVVCVIPRSDVKRR